MADGEDRKVPGRFDLLELAQFVAIGRLEAPTFMPAEQSYWREFEACAESRLAEGVKVSWVNERSEGPDISFQ